MAFTELKDLALGTVVKSTSTSGKEISFRIVHIGNPNSSFYQGCSSDSVWLISEATYSSTTWGKEVNSVYAGSPLDQVCRSFRASLNENLKAKLLPIELLVTSGYYNSFIYESYDCFSLSAIELSPSAGAYYGANYGTTLDYFNSTTNSIRQSSDSKAYWTRSTYSSTGKGYITSQGALSYVSSFSTTAFAARPCIVLNGAEIGVDTDTSYLSFSSLALEFSGDINNEPSYQFEIATNLHRTFSSTKALGAPPQPFIRIVSADGNITVTDVIFYESSNSLKLIKAYSNNEGITSVTLGDWGEEGFSAWQKVADGNGEMMISIRGLAPWASLTSTAKGEICTITYSYKKEISEGLITLKTPLSLEGPEAGDISMAVLTYTGEVPADAVVQASVTNNGNDTSPIWQECLSEVVYSKNIIFENVSHENNSGFNFKLNFKRGKSNTGGYITSVQGAFQ